MQTDSCNTPETHPAELEFSKLNLDTIAFDSFETESPNSDENRSKTLSPKQKQFVSALRRRSSVRNVQPSGKESTFLSQLSNCSEPSVSNINIATRSSSSDDEDISIDCLHALRSLKVKDVKKKGRYLRFKTYKRCFRGKDAVDLLVSLGHAQTRTEAVEIGRKALEKHELFRNVTSTHRFEDGDQLYTFEHCPNVSKLSHRVEEPIDAEGK